jgi:hypothetical protein
VNQINPGEIVIEPLEFISEDDLHTFEGWLKYQAIDTSVLSDSEQAAVRELFEDAVKRRDTARKVGRMKLKMQPREYRYALAVRDGNDLWLTLWVRRSPKPEFFVFQPRGDHDWNPHASLHADGTFHLKSHGRIMLPPVKRQPPNSIRGSETLGAYAGHGPKSVGAVCDPQDFTGVFEIGPGVLGPRNGTVVVDLLEHADSQPLAWPGREVERRLFTAVAPYVLFRIIET